MTHSEFYFLETKTTILWLKRVLRLMPELLKVYETANFELFRTLRTQ